MVDPKLMNGRDLERSAWMCKVDAFLVYENHSHSVTIRVVFMMADIYALLQ